MLAKPKAVTISQPCPFASTFTFGLAACNSSVIRGEKNATDYTDYTDYCMGRRPAHGFFGLIGNDL